MNIFYLDKCPEKAARLQYNKHVVKMILESAQMLCTAHHVYGNPDDVPYKQAHLNHPSTVWCRQGIPNYMWLYKHMIALGTEYTKRYGRRHKCQDVIEDCLDNQPSLPNIGSTPLKLAMPDEYKSDCPIQSYRDYYMGDKRHLADWKTQVPNWWN